MPLIIDTGATGDTVASLLLALRSPWAKAEDITVNAGNVAFDQETAHALKTVDVANLAVQVPVYPGARTPLRRPWISAAYVHRDNGVGDSWFPPVERRPAEKKALDPAFFVEDEEDFGAMTTRGLYTRGTSVVDRLGVLNQPPNARVCLRADSDRFKTVLMRMLETGNTGLEPSTSGGWPS